MKTNELTGAALDWAVAKCMGHRVAENYGSYIRIYLPDLKQSGYTLAFCPSTRWSLGGPIIEHEGIGLDQYADYPKWQAFTPAPEQPSGYCVCNGPTPLVAAMRCYVASKMGDDIEIPTELGETK